MNRNVFSTPELAIPWPSRATTCLISSKTTDHTSAQGLSWPDRHHLLLESKVFGDGTVYATTVEDYFSLILQPSVLQELVYAAHDLVTLVDWKAHPASADDDLAGKLFYFRASDASPITNEMVDCVRRGGILLVLVATDTLKQLAFGLGVAFGKQFEREYAVGTSFTGDMNCYDDPDNLVNQNAADLFGNMFENHAPDGQMCYGFGGTPDQLPLFASARMLNRRRDASTMKGRPLAAFMPSSPPRESGVLYSVVYNTLSHLRVETNEFLRNQVLCVGFNRHAHTTKLAKFNFYVGNQWRQVLIDGTYPEYFHDHPSWYVLFVSALKKCITFAGNLPAIYNLDAVSLAHLLLGPLRFSLFAKERVQNAAANDALPGTYSWSVNSSGDFLANKSGGPPIDLTRLAQNVVYFHCPPADIPALVDDGGDENRPCVITAGSSMLLTLDSGLAALNRGESAGGFYARARLLDTARTFFVSERAVPFVRTLLALFNLAPAYPFIRNTYLYTGLTTELHKKQSALFYVLPACVSRTAWFDPNMTLNVYQHGVSVAEVDDRNIVMPFVNSTGNFTLTLQLDAALVDKAVEFHYVFLQPRGPPRPPGERRYAKEDILIEDKIKIQSASRLVSLIVPVSPIYPCLFYATSEDNACVNKTIDLYVCEVS